MPVRICQRPGLLYSSKFWEELEETLSADMCVIADFLSAWKLKLSVTKTIYQPLSTSTVKKRQLAVNVRGNTLTYKPNLSCGSSWIVKWPKSNKILARNNLLRCLAGSSWVARTSTIRTSALNIVYSAAEYAAPVWCSSPHSRKLDVALNGTLCLIAGYLRPPNRAIVNTTSIAPPNMRREQLTYELECQGAFSNQHPVHGSISHLVPSHINTPSTALSIAMLQPY